MFSLLLLWLRMLIWLWPDLYSIDFLFEHIILCCFVNVRLHPLDVNPYCGLLWSHLCHSELKTTGDNIWSFIHKMVILRLDIYRSNLMSVKWCWWLFASGQYDLVLHLTEILFMIKMVSKQSLHPSYWLYKSVCTITNNENIEVSLD